MSAIRRKDRRAALRSLASPYARTQPKQSSWSLSSILSYLNPLKYRSTSEDIVERDSSVDFPPESSDEEPDIPVDSPAARSRQFVQGASTNGKPVAPPAPSRQAPPPTGSFFPPVTPVRAPLPFPLQESSSPAKNLETVSTFLSERAGKSISNVEVEGLISLIQKSTPADKPEPFRFSSSTPSTPGRGNSPFLPQTDKINFGFTTPGPSKQAPTSRKTLTKNPNGVYRWEGGGSAKPARSRNRYSSPAFGASRGGVDRVVLKDNSTEAPKTDTKRRRVGDDLHSSSATPSGVSQSNIESSTLAPRSAAPEPSPTISKFPFPVSTPQTPQTTGSNSAATAKSNNTPARLRIPGPTAKPTAPAIPSPLRQAWSGGSPASQSDSSDSQPPQKQTKAANFMAELIKEVTPPKKPDVSNPYQTASPVGRVGTTTKPRVGRRTRATGKPAAPESNGSEKTKGDVAQKAALEKESQYSPQFIIETTLPKGSKRSRPPAHLEPPSPVSPSEETEPPSPRRSPRPRVAVLPSKTPAQISTQITDKPNDDQRVSKKPKPSLNGLGAPSQRKSPAPIPSIVVEEIDDSDMISPEKPIIETPDDEVEHSPPAVAENENTTAAVVSPTNVSIVVPPAQTVMKSRSIPKEPSKLRFSYQPESGSSSPAATPVPLPPPQQDKMEVDKLEPIVKVETKPLDPKAAASTLPISSLPTFVFTVSHSFEYPDGPDHVKARELAKSAPKSSLPTFDFTAPSRMTKSTAVEKEGLSATVMPPPPVPVPVVKAFDWAAAGVKPPPAPGGSTWSCKTCMLSNPADAVDKCTICGEPR